MSEISEDEGEARDLFGGPQKPLPDKRGRRKLRFPGEVYERVEVLAATGTLTQEEIADAIGISVPTLTKYFRKELEKAVSRQKAEALTLLAAAARKGNVSAIKEWNRILDQRSAASAYQRQRRGDAQPATPAASEPEGKKAAATAQAQAAIAGGGMFAPRAARLATVDGAAVDREDR